MEISLAALAAVILSLSAGSMLGYFARQTIAKRQLSTAEGKVASMLEEAKKEARETALNAKNRAVEILEEAKKKEKNKEDQIIKAEQRVERREEILDKKMDELEKGRNVLNRKRWRLRTFTKKLKKQKEKK